MALDRDQLAAFQQFAVPYMRDRVEVFRPTVLAQDETNPGYVPEYDFGDDDLYPVDPPSYTYAYVDDLPVYPYGEDGPVWSGLGWMFSHIQQNVSEGGGQMGTIDIHEIRLPITADISPMDLLRLVISGDVFVVVDTNKEDTWPDMLRASLRRRE